MIELEYPFDAKYLITAKKKIRKKLCENLHTFASSAKKRIAVLGGSTTKDIVLVLDLFLLNNGLECEFYESEYNQYYEDSMFPNAELEAFNPDIIYICTSTHNITRLPKITDSKDMVDSLLEREVEKFSSIWNRLSEVYQCPIIQNNFEMPFCRILGNKDASDYHGALNFVTRLNLEFYKYAQCHENFFICDINYISADYGLSKWHDLFYYYMYKYALAVPAIPYLSFNVANIIKSLFGKNKKGFVLDLDNTLWGGVIGDDGVDNIELGADGSVGQSYSEFQRYLKAHKDLGIILSIASKNEYENALAGLNHPDSDLKPDDFTIIKANWNPKDQNFLEISKELNLLPESLVFIDDNPAEREIVSKQLGVNAPNIGQVQNYIQTIDHAGFFETTNISTDDLRRNEMYAENNRRENFKASFENYDDYLKSLGMKAVIKPFESLYMSRIAQLTNKSNQFNLTTKRCSQTDIENFAADKNYVTLYGKLEDKFGDNGVVSVVLGHFGKREKPHADSKEFHIDLWLMSCRVLKRGMEDAMLDVLVSECKKHGIEKIYGYYYPTAKNKMVKDFYGRQGFEKSSEDGSGNSVWIMNVKSGYENRNTFIRII